jgi:hypothetical protein
MLLKLKRTQIPLATNAKKIDNINVNIIEDIIFSVKILDFFSSGDKIPIWRLEPNLELNAPNIFPLIPIAPGIKTKSPGNVSKKNVIFPKMIPANKSPIAHIKSAVNPSLITE